MPKRGLTLTEARQIALTAQGLDRRRTSNVHGELHRLRSIQLDTISVLARSHELVPYARLGAVGKATVERAYWGSGNAFEYWSHAACLLPVESYPHFAFRRRASVARKQQWGVDARAVRNVRAMLRDNGPQTATELGGARRTPGWWAWSDAKNAVEWMLATGEVVVMDRQAWKRVYSLTESSIDQGTHPDWVTQQGVYGPTNADCVRALMLDAVRALGIGTFDDIKDVHRLRSTAAAAGRVTAAMLRDAMDDLVASGEVARTSVDGWETPTFVDPKRIARLARTSQSVTTLLSPFDSLVWYRPRLERLFNVRLRIEAYTPKQDRKHGYFAMPTLHNGNLIGLVDPARDGDTLVAKRISAFTDDVDGFAHALAEAATWVDKSSVRVDSTSSSKRFGTAVQRAANALLNSRATSPHAKQR